MKSMCRFSFLLFVLTVICTMNVLRAQVQRMYVGTYTTGSDSKGVYVYDFDEKSGDATFVRTIPMSNPSFLARKNNILYAVNEDSQGMLTVYDLDNNKTLSHVSTQGMHPCHISLSPKDPVVVVSNYSSGTLSLFALNTDGSIQTMDDFIEFKGSSINTERQKQSHIHSAFFTKDGPQVYVSDLGADLIYVFEIVKKEGKYTFHKVQELKSKSGGGPRHLVFSKDEKTLYSILEMTGEVQVFKKERGQWVPKQIVPMYLEGFRGEHGGADIKITKDGKHVFATNRGTANLIFNYVINADGLLEVKSYTSVAGDSPRNLNLSPKEKFIFVSNQNSSLVNLFSLYLINEVKPKKSLQIPKPVCVIF